MDQYGKGFVSILLTILLSLIFLTSVSAETAEPPHVYCEGSICNVGWQSEVEDGATFGTPSSDTRIEAIQMRLSDTTGEGSHIKYQVQVQDVGWTDEVSDGALAGTTGQDKQIEALRIGIEGNISETYDLYYRVFSEDLGWLGWTKDSNDAGTIGIGEAIGAIEVKLVPKNSGAPGSTDYPSVTADTLEDYSDVSYNAHVSDIGWQDGFENGNEAGTTGEARQIEALTVDFEDLSLGSDLNYSVHVDQDGWLDAVSNAQEAGTEGEGKAIQAMAIDFNGPNEKMYDVFYQVHVQDIGWLDWAENGQVAGTTGGGKAVEAFRIVVQPKGDPAPGPMDTPYMELEPEPISASDATWLWPLDGIYNISSGFGPRSGFGSSNHMGIDILAPAGTPIRAARSGSVTVAQPYYGYGNCVVIVNDNTGEEVYYAHMSQIGTCVGTHVNQGDVIGYVGMTGTANANHLHLGVCASDGTWIDPTVFY